jgi:hypothetical protein
MPAGLDAGLVRFGETTDPFDMGAFPGVTSGPSPEIILGQDLVH